MARLEWGTCSRTWSNRRSGLRVLVEPALAKLCNGFNDQPGTILVPLDSYFERSTVLDGLRLSGTNAPVEIDAPPGYLNPGSDRIQLALDTEGGEELIGSVVFTVGYSYRVNDLVRALLASTARLCRRRVV
jgi:hypothetical protein